MSEPTTAEWASKDATANNLCKDIKKQKDRIVATYGPRVAIKVFYHLTAEAAASLPESDFKKAVQTLRELEANLKTTSVWLVEHRHLEPADSDDEEEDLGRDLEDWELM